MIYPQHERLKEVEAEHRTVLAFMEWLQSQGCEVGLWDRGHLEPMIKKPVALAAEFFGVDLVELENERCAMLEAQRAANKA